MAVREVERFEAVSDAGKRYTVVRYAEQVPFQPLSGPTEWHDGSPSYELLNGGDVNMKDASTFQIFDTDEIIRKV
jgi:hypothetical protein